MALILAMASSACTGGSPLECGTGTHRVGSACVADVRHDGGAGPASDAGTPPPPPPPASDAGPGFSVYPPGYDAGPGAPPAMIPPGCDEAAGECDAWTTDLMALVQAARSGCSSAMIADPRLVAVATRHADYQASIDRIDPTSPDGPLFMQVTSSGVRFTDAAVLFASTRDGAADVMARWTARTDGAGYLSRCWGLAGASFATSASGQSFVTILFVMPSPV